MCTWFSHVYLSFLCSVPKVFYAVYLTFLCYVPDFSVWAGGHLTFFHTAFRAGLRPPLYSQAGDSWCEPRGTAHWVSSVPASPVTTKSHVIKIQTLKVWSSKMQNVEDEEYWSKIQQYQIQRPTPTKPKSYSNQIKNKVLLQPNQKQSPMPIKLCYWRCSWTGAIRIQVKVIAPVTKMNVFKLKLSPL